MNLIRQISLFIDYLSVLISKVLSFQNMISVLDFASPISLEVSVNFIFVEISLIHFFVLVGDLL